MTPSSDNLIKAYDYVYSSTSDTTTTWKDLLTEYDGDAIEYDAIGNPTTYRGKTMLWNGRELTGFYNSETAAAYTYDASGIRTSKVHYGETYYYYYVEGQLMSESCSQYDLIYTYDSNGNLSGIKKYLADGTEEKYGAVCNIFGDVVALYNSSGTLIAQYNYDTWGKLLSITNASGTDISGTAGIWTQNSIRYRGYVYDNETGWYYLQSRYYDPDTCRFINADGMITATNDFTINLFAYAACNPLVNIDPTGTCPYNGTKEDFIRLEQGLPSVDCTCGIVSLVNGLSYINELFSFGTDAALDLAGYANNTGTRPNNIGVGTFNKQIEATNKSLQSASNVLNTVFNGISAVLVVYGIIENAAENYESGESKQIIVWDVIVDITFGATSIVASSAASTAVGAFIGSFCPIPVIGTLGGAIVGCGVGLVFDWLANETKSLYRKSR